MCVYDIKLISAPARWSPIGRCRGDYAPTVAAGDCIGEEVVVEVGERGCRWVTGAGETASLVRSIGVVMCASAIRLQRIQPRIRSTRISCGAVHMNC